MRKLISFLVAIVVTTNLWAELTPIDGIFYELNTEDKTAEVTVKGNVYYTGTVIIPEQVTYYDVTYSVIAIGRGAFWSCSDLISVTIPHSVTAIRLGAFKYCSALPSITIPNSVETIEEQAFYDCSSLAEVYVSWTANIPTLGTDAFKGIKSGAILFVPSGMVHLYETKGWNAYFTIKDLLLEVKATAIAEINVAVEGITDADILSVANKSIEDIKAAKTPESVNSIKEQALANLELVIKIHNNGKSEGKTEAFGELGTEKSGTAVKVTKGEKEVILYAPDKVEYVIKK